MSSISTKSAPHYQWGKRYDGWHLVQTDNLSVIQECMPAGCYESRHYHQHAEQFFYILSGCATMQLQKETILIHANEGLHVAAGKLHQLSNLSDADLHFIVTSTPPSHGDKIKK